MFLFYAYDASDRAKQRIAQSLVRRAIAAEMVTSTQALAEFAATLLQKLSPAARPAARPADVAAILDMLGPIIAIALVVCSHFPNPALYANW
jgi:hypothetical protein